MADKGYLEDKTTDPKSMRYFVNSRLADKKNNRLWGAFETMMAKGGPKLGENLINIILKTKLYDQIDAKKLKKVKFDFVLITGIGDVKFPSKKPPVVHIGGARVDSLKTTLCGLTRISEDHPGDYKIIQDSVTEQKSDAAKVFFKLMKGDFHIMDVRIRYKGSFNPKPQFQAYMSKVFKEEISKECSG